MSGRKIFLAGGTGVLGRRVTPLLVEAGHDVTVNTRNPAAAEAVGNVGATAVTVDLFDAAAVAEAVEPFDAVVNIATAIPTGPAAGLKKNWLMNDRIRTEAAANLAAGLANGDRYVGESITFPYVDRGDEWIDESVERTYSSATESVAAAEATAASVDGVALRFAMFSADDSGHNADLFRAARMGVFGLPGGPDAFISWVHIDDAATAVLAALDAPAGIYNVAEPDPVRRADHMSALASAFGKRRRLRGLPAALVKLGGPPVETIARSQRISSDAFASATGWSPKHRMVEEWTA